MKCDATTRFSNRVANYIKYRPSYPKPLLDLMFGELGLSEKSTVADVGSGTGIFTQLLLDRGATVYAVEPNAEMRSAAEQMLKGYKKFHSIAQPAERTELPESSVDMVCAATAFHWFDAAAVKIEWKRILRPGGTAFLVWNVRREAAPFLSDYESMLHRYGTDYSEAKHRNTEDNSGMTTLFASNGFREIAYPNEQNFDFDGLVGRLLSSSYTPVKGHPNHDPMMRELKVIFEKHQQNGKIKFEYDSKAYFGSL